MQYAHELFFSFFIFTVAKGEHGFPRKTWQSPLTIRGRCHDIAAFACSPSAKLLASGGSQKSYLQKLVQVAFGNRLGMFLRVVDTLRAAGFRTKEGSRTLECKG